MVTDEMYAALNQRVVLLETELANIKKQLTAPIPEVPAEPTVLAISPFGKIMSDHRPPTG